MYTSKILVIAFSLILLCIGVAVWANTTEFNLSQKMKTQKINSFEECVKAGYPIQESFPRKCLVGGGVSFTEVIKEELSSPSPEASTSETRFEQPEQTGEV